MGVGGGGWRILWEREEGVSGRGFGQDLPGETKQKLISNFHHLNTVGKWQFEILVLFYYDIDIDFILKYPKLNTVIIITSKKSITNIIQVLFCRFFEK